MTETAQLADYVLPAAVAVREVRRRRSSTSSSRDNVLPPPPPGPRPAAGHAARARDPRPPRRGARRARRTSTSRPLRRGRRREPRRVRRRVPRGHRAITRSSVRSRRSCCTARSARPCPAGAASAAVLWGAAQRCAHAEPADASRAPASSAKGSRSATRSSTRSSPARQRRDFTRRRARRQLGASPHPRRSAAPRHARALEELDGARDRSSRPAATPSSRSCSRPASAARSRPTPSSATRRGASATPTAPCGCPRPTPIALRLADGDTRALTTRRGTADGPRRDQPRSCGPATSSLPNGLGLDLHAAEGERGHGVAPNELTSSDHRDPIAGTPWHKHVPARLEPIAS